MGKPFLSIVVRTKDRPELLKDALESIASQGELSRDTEVVVVNDGGVDVSDVLEGFKGKLVVKYLKHERNLGRAKAANTGLKAAEGVWVGLLDDDDLFVEGALERLFSRDLKGVDVVYGKVEIHGYDDQGNYRKLGELAIPFNRHKLLIVNYIPTCGLFFKRKLGEKVGGFDESFDVLEDWDFIFRLSQEKDFLFIPETLAIYRAFASGYIREEIPWRELEYREKFYKKHWNSITPKTLTIAVLEHLKDRRREHLEEHRRFMESVQALEKEKKLLEEELQELRGFLNCSEKEKDSLKEEKERLEKTLKKLEDEKDQLSKTLESLKEEKELLEEKLLELDATIKEIINSTSWRITHPLRILTSKLSRIFSFFKRSKKARKVGKLHYTPKISVLIPVYNPKESHLRKCLDSVFNQTYENWELCIVDDGSTLPYVRSVLERYKEKGGEKVKVLFKNKNEHICVATNQALSMATGEFIALLDHDDELHRDALLEVVKLLNSHPEADMIYTDEDKIGFLGRRKEAYYKPDWSPEFILGQMYTCHLGVYRKSVVEEVGGFRKGFEGSQDHDLVLRISEITDKIFHIPKVLYHWRIHSGSAASSIEAKKYAYDAGLKAVEEALKRRNLKGSVEMVIPGRYLVHLYPSGRPEVDIVIPSKDLPRVLERCVKSIVEKSSYKNFRITVVDNGSEEKETFLLYEDLEKELKERFRVLEKNTPFNFSELVNFGIDRSDSEIILLLNNDTELISPENWLEEMIGYAQKEYIGCVGVVLLYPDNTIQHAGVILGIKGHPKVPGVAGHAFKYLPADHPGYFDRLKVVSNYSAVTGACMMFRKKLWEEVGGFDEELSVAFNDIDFCLKLLRKGYRHVVLPHVRLYHHESKSRGYEDTREKQKRFMKEINIMRERWAHILDNDPYYNPNLPKDREDFGLR